MVGYFIRLGDKTSCGGQVTGSDNLITMFGIEHAREGDNVTCGVTGLTYQIFGGVSHITSSDRPVAGTLDSISGCPCRAMLYHSFTFASYEKAVPHQDSASAAVSPETATSTGSQPGRTSAASAGQSPSPTSAAQDPEECSGCFQLLNQRQLPCGLHTYVLLQDGEQVAESQLNDEGFSHIGTSCNPISAQIATNAPSPVLE
ncbi:MAG TPA: hypothetical protein DIT18_09895 [Pseudomonas sp.]|nr:hypothetical protein [Pseudomonas sp.]